jgi:hypothetical protein
MPGSDAIERAAIRGEIVAITSCLVQIHTVLGRVAAALPAGTGIEVYAELKVLTERLQETFKRIEANQ